MPDSMETAYQQWTGRKATSLRRPVLDCGHRNRPDREVHFHIWCDRLSCSPACAEAEHDCGAFSGAVTSGTEERPSPAEVARATAAAAAGGPARPPFTLPRDDWDALYGTPEPHGTALTTTGAGGEALVAVTNPGDPASVMRHEVDSRENWAALYTALDEYNEALVTFSSPEEWQQANPAAPAVCSCPDVDVSTMAEGPGTSLLKGYDPGCRVCPKPPRPRLAAALEPAEAPKPAPWWRRMLPGGNR